MKQKQAHLVAHNGYYTCSKCGVKYSEIEYFNYYSPDKLKRWHINCKACGTVFNEDPPKCQDEFKQLSFF